MLHTVVHVSSEENELLSMFFMRMRVRKQRLNSFSYYKWEWKSYYNLQRNI